MPLEQIIARELWRWQSVAEEDRALVLGPQSELECLIEGYLCDAFQYPNSAQSRNWWCDGVEALSVTEVSPTSFFLVGVAYWADGTDWFYLAPFELEFDFAAPQAIAPSRAIVRFGATDDRGQIVKAPCEKAVAARLLANRPTRNQDWAFAIELT